MNIKSPTENPLSTKERLDSVLVDGQDGKFVEMEYNEALIECPIKGHIMLVKDPNGTPGYQISVDDSDNINTTDYGGSYGITIILDTNGHIIEANNNRPLKPLHDPETALEEILSILEKGESAPKPGHIDYSK